MTLFDRVRRPIQLTSAGAALLQLANPLVEGMDSLMGRDGGRRGQGDSVSVATMPDLVSHHLLNVVHGFRQAHPKVHVLNAVPPYE